MQTAAEFSETQPEGISRNIGRAVGTMGQRSGKAIEGVVVKLRGRVGALLKSLERIPDSTQLFPSNISILLGLQGNGSCYELLFEDGSKYAFILKIHILLHGSARYFYIVDRQDGTISRMPYLLKETDNGLLLRGKKNGDRRFMGKRIVGVSNLTEIVSILNGDGTEGFDHSGFLELGNISPRSENTSAH